MDMNYLRTLRPAKCTKCDYTGHDVDFEDYNVELDKDYGVGATYNAHIKIICPKCKEINTMKYLDDETPPRIYFPDLDV